MSESSRKDLNYETKQTDMFVKLDNFVIEGQSNGDEEAPPEEAIPDLPENASAREFLKSAPSRGLYMPVGKQVKVMQCFRCKAYGHRTNDKECPLAQRGNLLLDSERQAREDPMSVFVANKIKLREEKYSRANYLKQIMEEIRKEETEKKRKRELKKDDKKRKRREKKHSREKDKRIDH